MKDRIRNGDNLSSQIGEALHDIASTQRQELRSLKAQIPDPDSINLFEWYKKDARFRKTYHEAMGYALIPGLNSVGKRNLESNFAGITFENIAFVVCALKENSNGITILSPKRTNQLLKYLYPDARTVDFPFREGSLGDDSIPDGIGINKSGLKDNVILNIYEYTLSLREDVFRRKYDFFREKKRNFPQLFSNAILVFVLPETAILPNVNASDIRFIQTNFTRSDFGDFITEAYCNYTVSNDIATLKEMEGWRVMPPSGDLKKRQLDRTVKYFLAGIN